MGRGYLRACRTEPDWRGAALRMEEIITIFVEKRSILKLGDCIEAIGTPPFTDQVHRYFDEVFGVAYSAVSVFRLDMTERFALQAGATREVDHNMALSLAMEYVGDHFLHDVHLAHHASTKADAIYAQSDVDVEDQMIKERYYERMRIASELSGYVNVSGRLYYVGIFRTDDLPPFAAADMDLFSVAAPLISRACHCHFALTGDYIGRAQPAIAAVPSPAELREAALTDLAAAIASSSSALTPRESQVCAAVVLGYTTVGIAALLDISANTVATHRKRAYAKLRISSQSELFINYSHIVRRNVDAGSGEPVQRRVAVNIANDRPL